MVFPVRSETVSISTAPVTVSPTTGQLEYYGADGYLCKTYPPNFTAPYSPTGTDKNAVALAMSRQVDANGEAIYQGSAMYDGKQYSWYYTQSTGLGFVVNVVTQYICPAGSEGSPSYNCSVIPNSRNNPNECCPCGYAYDAGQRMCVVNLTKITACAAQCPAVAAGEIPFHLDPGGQTCSRPDQCLPPNAIDPSTGKCGPKCPVDPLPPLPKDDLCAQSLEAGRGSDINHACPSLIPEMQKQADCLAAKIRQLALSSPYTGPSATIRNAAYQKHLREVWDKSIEIEEKDMTDEQELACATIIADVDNQKRQHHIKYGPSNKGNEAPHVLGRAIDIPSDVVDALKKRVTNTTFVTFTNCILCIPIAVTTVNDVQDYINNATVNPPACNLKWGGRFKTADPVHFQLP